MRDPRSSARPIRFGEIEADLSTGEVGRAGTRIILPDQPLRILARLIERAGELVTREELQQELWSDTTFVDFEHGLNSAVKRLRDALGDSAEAPRYIETVPRRGYRFIAPIVGVAPPVTAGSIRATTPRPERRTVVLWSRKELWGGAALLAGLLLLAGWLVVTLTRSGSTDARAPLRPLDSASNLVAVAPFENRTGDPSLASIGPLAANRIIGAIGTLGTAGVVLEGARPDASVGPSSARAPGGAAGTAGAALAVSGAYYDQSGRLEFQARILDAVTGQPLYVAPPIVCGRERPAEAFEQLEQTIAGAVAIHFDHAFGGLPITSRAPLLDAYLEYRAGRDIFDRDYERAVAHLQRSLAISPDFFLPRLTLAMAYENMGDVELSAGEVSRLADRADRLTKAEHLLLEWLAESQARRPANALRALQQVEELAPQSGIVNYSLQMEALILNRPTVTIDAFNRLPLHDRYGRFNGWRLEALARALHDIGEYERELDEVNRAQEYEPASLRIAASKTRALAALGRYDDLVRVIDESLAVSANNGTAGQVMEYAARELRAHRQPDRSRAVAARAVEWYRARPPSADEANRAALARVLYLAGRWDESFEAFVALAAEHPGSVEYVGFLGAIAARRGQGARAREISDRLRDFTAPHLFGRQTYWRACIAAVLGEKQQALDFLREALSQGEYLGLFLHQSPHLDSLRAFAPFLELTRPRVATPSADALPDR